jgi:hypothetical protein
MSAGIIGGNTLAQCVVQLTISPVAVSANTTAQQTFTLAGLLPGDVVSVVKPTHQAGLGLVGSRVTAADTLGITFSNNTGSSITPTAGETYLVLVTRPENSNLRRFVTA